ncbi:MAG: nitrilase family protein [Muribaculaceae bacterium]|nr:nitrilase family protein [Muribaculaceae bacterium]
MSKDLKIALLPLNIKWNDKEANLSALEKIMADVHPMTDLLILPETFSTGFPPGMDKEEVRVMAERNTGPTVSYLKELSKKHKLAICGSFIADTGGCLYNRLFFLEPSGEEYFEDKRHLFTMAGEHNIFSRGNGRMKVRFRGWEIAMIACYDIRFPVWCRNKNNEYDLLIAVANWPKPRVGAWDALLKARAIENEAYVCGVNCKGIDPKDFEYDGTSDVYDFKGKSVTVRMEGSEIIYATLSRERLDSFREKFPAWRDADSFQLT